MSVTDALLSFSRWLEAHKIPKPTIIFEQPKDFLAFRYYLEREVSRATVSAGPRSCIVESLGIRVQVALPEPWPELLERIQFEHDLACHENPVLDVDPVFKAGFELGIKTALREVGRMQKDWKR